MKNYISKHNTNRYYMKSENKKLDYYDYMTFIREQSLQERDFVFLRYKINNLKDIELVNLKKKALFNNGVLNKVIQTDEIEKEIDALNNINYSYVPDAEYHLDTLSLDVDSINKNSLEWY